ncbi:efflux transporter, outer membrane factor lipoprotein, NodT family [Burkholderia sp. Ch1-1]|uniref:Efflux transporter, outer membrane factor lipoprotein, NodT family n=1 Tax=Paraburkholderia dioscoreae TaxID=2604047 RepID=A0A5Q4ZN55_9BURK|nr:MULTISPECIES: efflux transporter outer membrane subunit [Paraburkholderia]EIF34941.1 efflux transporter, outer membrane factor lipoprotein, NodT family [Burkholderia sp. Ch1-1]MDR8396499.1 efflux transporter outer membrane subunit [Paraburkholderia sp. USG1]VVD34123.1 Efflux transporter, outer membrane factor lipoprotein, NodT family [Paraburkholderia dioscoreae]
MRRPLFRLLPAMCACWFAGCTVGPNYQRPAVDTPSSFRYASPDAEVVDQGVVQWWSQFDDPVLDSLIERALVQNRDLAIAAARVDEFYGRLMTTRAGLFPQIGANFAGSRSRGVPAPGFAPTVGNQVQLDVMASWEIDLFGRLRRMTEAARADYLGTQAVQQATRIALIASVATSYLLLRDLDQRLDIAKSTLASRADALALFQERFGGGVVSQLQVSQAKSEYESAQASVYAFQQQIAQQENALSLLLGDNPGPIPRGKPLTQLSAPTIPAGLPSSLLERRPDILQAEQALVSANASIGAARAQYFPTISLTGVFGAASTALSGLWTGPARVWSFAGAIAQPIFTGGAITGSVRIAEAQQQEALFGYEQTIQSAFADVENALVGVARVRDQLQATNRQVEALAQYASLARDLYEGGYTSYLEVLDAERSLFAAQLQQSQLQDLELAQIVALYKALGYGWTVDAGSQAPAAGLNILFSGPQALP